MTLRTIAAPRHNDVGPSRLESRHFGPFLQLERNHPAKQLRQTIPFYHIVVHPRGVILGQQLQHSRKRRNRTRRTHQLDVI